MSGLRLGIITREWSSGLAESGGIGTYFRNLATGLARGHAHPVVLAGPSSEGPSPEPQCQFPVIHLPEPKPSLPRRVLDRLSPAPPSWQADLYYTAARRRAALRKHLSALIVEHRLQVLLGPLWTGELADLAPRTRLPVIVRASGNIQPIVRANAGPPGEHDHRLHKLEQQVLLTCSAFYAPSNSALRDLLGCMTAPPVPHAVIPSGVDCRLFKPAPQDPRRDACRLLFVGRLEPQKGLPLLAAALPRLLETNTRAQVWFVGRDTPSAPGGATWREHFYKTSPRHVFRRCGFFGRLPWSRLPDLYRQCDLLLVPSVRDNLPNAALEAMASGLPVVASSSAGLNDLIRPRQNGLILDGPRADQWTQTLADLAADRPTLRHMGACARSTVEKELSLHAAAQPVIELCHRVLHPHTAPCPALATPLESRPL